jgi:RNA polymerase sigma-70 factor (ECF subfamily)
LIESAEFIALLKKREDSAFNQLLEEYQHMVYNSILNIVQHELSTWIYRITYTTALEWERKKKTGKAINYFKNLIGINEQKDSITSFDHPGVSMENKENAKALFIALSKLPEQQRIAFLLIKSDGLSYQETSEIMNKSIKSLE